jgi:hypothetical protein
MNAPAVQDLLDAEARLDRSFAVCLAAFLVSNAWPVYLRVTDQDRLGWAQTVGLVLAGVFLAAYVWFAYAAAAAAARLGQSRGLYLAWLIAAPLLGVLPIPIVSLIIQASPLSLKFLLSGQLRAEIHQRTLAD